MTKIRVTGWQVGFQKISCTRFLQKEMDVGLAAAKELVDKILEKEVVEIDISKPCKEFSDELTSLGLVFEVLKD